MKQKKLPVWNSFDEFGLLVGLGHWTENGRELKYVRYPGETNSQLKERILKVYKNKSNSTYQGMVNSLSRDFLTSEYNIVTQYHYFLTEEPYAQASGIKVFSSGNGTWSQLSPQIRASGYPTATSGWIVWNYPDNENNYGRYTQILEFIGTSLPDNNVPIKIEYQILDNYDENGKPVLQWLTDKDESSTEQDDYRFRIKKSVTPEPSSQIVIHRLNSLATDPFSGTWYTNEGAASSKLKEVANYLNKKHPVEWGNIPWDTMTWENSANLSQGVLPTLFDAELPIDQSGHLESDKFIGGIGEGPNLYMIEIVKEEDSSNSGVYSKWYPRIYPGKFYISNTGYYLFENKQIDYMHLTNNSGSLNFTDNPNYENLIIIGTSGYIGMSGDYMSELYRYPYGSGQDFNSTGIYRRVYNIKEKIDSIPSFSDNQYYINMENYFISGVSLANNIQVVWEHPDSSGLGKILSGIDLNPYNQNRENGILFVG